jgi:hypothetical protein
MTVLPGTPRFGGVPYRQAGIDPLKLFGTTPISDRIATRSILVSRRQHIARSDFNRTPRARRIGYLQGIARHVRQTARGSARLGRNARERKYLYLYWPRLDAIGHQSGHGKPGSTGPPSARSSRPSRSSCMDRRYRQPCWSARITGQLDSSPRMSIDLADHPTLAETLLLPLCGEPRAAFCYLRSGQLRLRDYCSDVLGGSSRPGPERQLVEEGPLRSRSTSTRASWSASGILPAAEGQRGVCASGCPSSSHTCRSGFTEDSATPSSGALVSAHLNRVRDALDWLDRARITKTGMRSHRR